MLLRSTPGDQSKAALHRRALTQAGAVLPPDEVLGVAAGFGVVTLLPEGGTARCSAGGPHLYRPAQRPARFSRPGTVSSPWGADASLAPHLPRQDVGCHTSEATTPWVVARRTVHAQVWDHLVWSTAKPGGQVLQCGVIHDPRDKEPLVVVTTLPVSAYALWCLPRDRWPVAQGPWRPSRGSAHSGRVCSVTRAASASQSWRCERAMLWQMWLPRQRQ